MSDDPNLRLIDLRQATLNHLVEAMRQIGEQVKASNNRYLRIEEEVAALRQATLRGFSDAADRSEELARDVRSLHSEVITQANQIIDAQQKAIQNAFKLADIEDRLQP